MPQSDITHSDDHTHTGTGTSKLKINTLIVCGTMQFKINPKYKTRKLQPEQFCMRFAAFYKI